MITVISKQTVLHRVGGDPLALEGISRERFLSHALPLSRPIKPGSLKVPTWLRYCCYCSLTNIFPEVWHTNSKMTNHKRQHTYHNQQPDQETKYYRHPGPSLCTPSSHRPAILLWSLTPRTEVACSWTSYKRDRTKCIPPRLGAFPRHLGLSASRLTHGADSFSWVFRIPSGDYITIWFSTLPLMEI